MPLDQPETGRETGSESEDSLSSPDFRRCLTDLLKGD